MKMLESTLNWLKKQNIKEDKIIIYGESLGTGVSLKLHKIKNLLELF